MQISRHNLYLQKVMKKNHCFDNTELKQASGQINAGSTMPSWKKHGGGGGGGVNRGNTVHIWNFGEHCRQFTSLTKSESISYLYKMWM